jgi:hypothetical protein
MLRTAIQSGVLASAFFLWMGTLWAADNGAASLDLVRDGAPAATIIVAKQPTRSAQFSAAELGRLMDQARAAAKTDLEKQRVALFDKIIWQYMLSGRKAYLSAHPQK